MEFPAILSEEIINICRICLCEVKVNDVMNLFSDQNQSKDIINKIFSCFQIRIVYQKFYPCAICKTCLNELEIANNFRIKCTKFEERFSEYLKQFTDVRCFALGSNLDLKILKDINDDATSEFAAEIEPDCDVTEQNFHHEVEVIERKKLKKHKKPRRSSSTEIFTCTLCKKIFKKQSSLIKHDVSMHQNRKHVGKVTGFGPSRRYHCTKCNYSTPYSQTLVTHIRRHTGEKPYHCKCGKSFTDLSTFNAHSTIHSSTTYYTCSTCGKQFKIAKALKQHLRSHETGKYACEVCNKVLKSRQTLQDHIRRHYNIRNFNCEDCGDTFVTSSELIHHKVKHKLDKNLECHLCGYKTLRRRNLIIHLKRHSNDRSFKCDQCDALFYSKADVRRHEGVHSREKAFQCSTCPKAFTRKAALNKHLQSHIVNNKWCGYELKASTIDEIKSENKLNKKSALEISAASNTVVI